MIVYPDLAFLLGVLVHGGILYLTLLLCDLPLQKGRYVLAVFVSAVGSALYCIPSIPVALLVFGGVLVYWAALRGKGMIGSFRNLATALAVLVAYVGAYAVISNILFAVDALGTTGGIFLFFGVFPVCREHDPCFFGRSLYRAGSETS